MLKSIENHKDVINNIDRKSAKQENRGFVDNDTGLYTPDYFEDRIQQEIYRAERCRHYLSLAVITILDKDDISKETSLNIEANIRIMIATLLKECKRRMDVACQYKAGSLYVLLPETQSEDAEKVASRIKETFEEYLTANPFVHQKSISANVCTYPSDARTSKELIEKTLFPIKTLN